MKECLKDTKYTASLNVYKGLTLDKKYEVVSENVFSFEIINDDGIKWFYRKIRFVSLDEFRDKKLKELGIC